MADETRIFKLHYFGARFANNRMPVDVLPDLPAFRELLLSFAKDEWRTRHPDRKKLPRNFDKEISLSLFDIADGSAIPQLEWCRSSPQISLFDDRDEIDEVVEAAYATVIAVFEGSDGEATSLDSEKLRALNRFGPGLKDDERIELTARDGSGKVVYLDMHRRKQLITGARDTYRSRLEGTGELVGTTSPSDPNSKCTIQVQTSKYGTISIPVDRLQLYEEFAGALNTEVQFELLVDLDCNDRLRSVVDVFDVTTIAGENGTVANAKERLEELGQLGVGWHNGEGNAVGRAALARSLDFVVAARATGVAFRIFPTVSGGVLIDFAMRNWEYSVEFSPNGQPEMYGIAADGPEEMNPMAFNSVDELVEEFVRRLSAHG